MNYFPFLQTVDSVLYLPIIVFLLIKGGPTLDEIAHAIRVVVYWFKVWYQLNMLMRKYICKKSP